MSKPLGIVVFKGKSKLDGKPIIAIATGIKTKTANDKIGDTIPIWIMRADIAPVLASKLGEDFSVCGDCKLRHFGACYVVLPHGPGNVFKAFHNDRYEMLNDDNIEHLRGKMVRIGAYGDPTAVDIEVWNKIRSVSKGTVSYTHQWKNPKYSDYKEFCMASVDTDKEYDKAIELGWKTFRTRLEDDVISENEFICPASKEGNRVTDCSKCSACSGTESKRVKTPSITVHGGGAQAFKVKRFEQGLKRIKNKKKWRIDFTERRKRIYSMQVSSEIEVF